MRKTLFAMASLVLVLSAAGCSDLATGLGYSSVTGTYNLQTFNGASLPALFDQSSFQERDLLVETFAIYSDGTYTDDYRMRVSDQTGTSDLNYHDAGTYQQNNTALQFRNSSTGDVFTGSITGNTLTITQFGDVYVFRR